MEANLIKVGFRDEFPNSGNTNRSHHTCKVLKAILLENLIQNT